MSTTAASYQAASPAPLLRRASDYRPRSVQWLWPGRIPIGSITLLAGNPGTGKSLFALDLAARVSRGAPFPDELPPPLAPSATTGSPHSLLPTACDNPQSEIPNPQSSDSVLHAPGSVLILSATDQFHDTVLPRLAAAGADQSRVYVLDYLTNLRADMDELRDTIEDLPDLKLLILDPINFYVGPGDAHFQTVVRTVLQPLAELARERGFAILAITHFRKNDGAAIERAAGSMGFVATARAIWTITADPEDESRRYLVPLKNNLTAPLSALSFQITDRTMTNDEGQMTNEYDSDSVIRHSEIRHSLSAPHLIWDNAACGLASPKPKRSTPRDEAQRFLMQALADGPRPANELFEEADARGLTRRTLQRAFHDLAGHTKKKGLRAGWWWALGEYPIDPLSTEPPNPLDDRPLTFASDVAARIERDRFLAELEARIAEVNAEIDDLGPPPGAVSPSQKPREKRPSTPTHPVSPSASFAVFPAPAPPKMKPSKLDRSPISLPLPPSLHTRNRPHHPAPHPGRHEDHPGHHQT